MSYYPKEGLITLHQAQNPPISQAITEELNKVGYGEFITETELNEALDNIETGGNQLTPEELTKAQALFPLVDITDATTLEVTPLTKFKASLLYANTLRFVNVNGCFSIIRNTDHLPSAPDPIVTFHNSKLAEFFNDVKVNNYLRTNNITPSTNRLNGLEIRNFSDNLIVRFNSSRLTEFFGEIITPSFSSAVFEETMNNVNVALSDVQQALSAINYPLSASENAFIQNLTTYSVGSLEGSGPV